MALMDEMEILYQAKSSRLGVVVWVSDFIKAQQRLYRARRESGDPELACLQIRRSPYDPDNELWLVRGSG